MVFLGYLKTPAAPSAPLAPLFDDPSLLGRQLFRVAGAPRDPKKPVFDFRALPYDQPIRAHRGLRASFPAALCVRLGSLLLFVCHPQKILTVGALLEFFPECNELALGNETLNVGDSSGHAIRRP